MSDALRPPIPIGTEKIGSVRLAVQTSQPLLVTAVSAQTQRAIILTPELPDAHSYQQ
jgi:hypothetical protein